MGANMIPTAKNNGRTVLGVKIGLGEVVGHQLRYFLSLATDH